MLSSVQKINIGRRYGTAGGGSKQEKERLDGISRISSVQKKHTDIYRRNGATGEGRREAGWNKQEEE